MAKVKFELNKPGLTEFLKGPEVKALLNSAASQIATAAGDGYEVETAHPIKWVAIAAVHAETPEARRDNSENDTLLKAAGSVRL